MNEDKAVALIAAGIIGATVVSVVKNKRRQQKIREEIKVETDREIKAIWTAADRVIDRIHAGLVRSLPQLNDDIKFEQIIAYNEQ